MNDIRPGDGVKHSLSQTAPQVENHAKDRHRPPSPEVLGPRINPSGNPLTLHLARPFFHTGFPLGGISLWRNVWTLWKREAGR